MKLYTLYTITNYQRKDLVSRFVNSFQNTTPIDLVELVVVENGDNMNSASLEHYIFSRTANFPFTYIDLVDRQGLARVWNICVEESKTDWVIICNDDCIFKHRWIESLALQIEENGNKTFLLSMPNGFSAFAIHKDTWKKYGGFRDEFTSGYYEDDDFFLRCGCTEGLHTKQEIIDKCFFSYADTYGAGLLDHVPSLPGQSHFKKWNKEENFKIFNQHWEEVPKGTPNAIENKNHKWYLYKDQK